MQVDLGSRLPGRGAYLCGQRQCWERALAKGDLLGRALRASLAPDQRDALLASAPAASADTTPASAPLAAAASPPGAATAEASADTNDTHEGARP